MAGIEGGEVELLCGRNLTSNPQANIMWSNNRGTPVNPADSTISIANGPTSVSLFIQNLSRRDSGDWSCSVSVEGVRTVLVSITLTVIGKNLMHHKNILSRHRECTSEI